MDTQDDRSTATRLLLILGAGLLLALAWQGGRMSASGMLPFGMMSPGHGEGMMGHGHTREASHLGEGDDFEGETGLQRCRSMMGTMDGMHQSMQSMMGMGARTDTSASRPYRDMMGGRMGRMHEGMENREPQMDAEQMRQICRTMHEAMRAAMHGEAVDSDNAADGAFEEAGLSAKTSRWLQSARGAESIVDRTGEEEVVIEVGAGDGLQYLPVVVRVDPGTTVRWRWTGQGGLHDVAFQNADLQTPLRGEAGFTFRHVFRTPGEYRYECTPHSGVGMRGAVLVSSAE